MRVLYLEDDYPVLSAIKKWFDKAFNSGDSIVCVNNLLDFDDYLNDPSEHFDKFVICPCVKRPVELEADDALKSSYINDIVFQKANQRNPILEKCTESSYNIDGFVYYLNRMHGDERLKRNTLVFSGDTFHLGDVIDELEFARTDFNILNKNEADLMSKLTKFFYAD